MKLSSNIWKYYLYNFFFLFVIFEPIFFVYLQGNLSFTLTQITIVGAFAVVLLGIFEIPTGVLGDKLGYKKTLLTLKLLGIRTDWIFAQEGI